VPQWRLTCPSVPGSSITVVLTGSPDPRQRPFGSGHVVPYPVSCARRTGGGPIASVPLPVAFQPPALASRVIHCPPGDWAFLAVGLPGHVVAPGPRWDYHVPHARDATGVGASCISGAAVLTRSTKNPRPAPAALQRPASPPRLPHPIRRGSRITRHQRRFTQFTRPVCPLPVTPGWNRGPSAFPWASHPAVTSDARQGRGQAFEHGPGTTPPA
jgi:hypothetical protein